MLDLTASLGAPGVRAFVSARADGSMGFTGAPDPDAVREARRRFLGAAGMDVEGAAAVRQVHGNRVLVAGAGERGRGGLDPARSLGEGDGIVTAERGLPLLALSADCGIVALATSDGRAAGVVHAGWRGGVARAPTAAVRALERLAGVHAGEIRAAFGPAAGPCCYEVGREVVDALLVNFGERCGPWIRPGRSAEHPKFDLPALVRAGLLDAGVPAESIGPPGPCTICGDAWFSHRRGDAGRQLLAVAIA